MKKRGYPPFFAYTFYSKGENYSMTKTTFVHDHLKSVSVLILKRLEMLENLEPLDNKTYKLVKESFPEFQKMSDDAKKLRLLLKNNRMYSRPLALKKKEYDNAKNLLESFNKHTTLILDDLVKVYNGLVEMVAQIKSELERRKLPQSVSIDFQPLALVIKDLKEITSRHGQVMQAFAVEVVLEKENEVKPRSPKAHGKGKQPPMVTNKKKKQAN